MNEELPKGYYRDDDAPQFSNLATHAMDADITLYWPWVRPCWEDQIGEHNAS